ncbi:hypothetical protein [Flavobacterium hungaricum]|uniref:Uncharacterized protein n=1 Tax=Flavobacterium hungaricum TaxID=2082725 RepID=A0ABR9TH81_9FLAO|nr:hypothetical protein [Flavobacterium hungaricum]MBE8724723.1 hypothetical protein [Flavobacterium hungaricum]
MKNKIVKLRSKLERNKIFFETFAATVLILASIYVSVQANNISNIQTEIMKLENTPKIEIRTTISQKDSVTTKWQIFNHNSKISNFELEQQFSFLSIRKRDETQEKEIPLMEYINGIGNFSGQNEGLIAEYDNGYYSQNEKIIQKELENYCFIQVRCFIEISFEDVLDKQTKYYQITPMIKEISEKDWELIKKDFSMKTDKKDRTINLAHDIESNIQKIKNYN